MNPTSRGSKPRRDDRRRGRDQKRNPTPWLAIALCVALAGCEIRMNVKSEPAECPTTQHTGQRNAK